MPKCASVPLRKLALQQTLVLLTLALLKVELEGPQAQEKATVAFTPSNILQDRCKARTWNNGKGGQCNAVPVPGTRYCKRHAATRAHGDVEADIPAAKLREFMRARGQG